MKPTLLTLPIALCLLTLSFSRASNAGDNLEMLYQQGRTAMNNGQYAEAVKDFQKLVAEEPNNAVFQQWLGRATGSLARVSVHDNPISRMRLASTAGSCFEKAVNIDPNNVVMRDDLALFYVSAPGLIGGSVRKAQEQVAEIKKRNPYAGFLAEGEVAQDQKKYADAQHAYESALKLDPKKAAAYNHLAELYNLMGEYKKAADICTKLLAETPNNPYGLYYKGMAGAYSGENISEAATSLEQFLQTPRDFDGPSFGSAHYLLGMIAEKQHDPAKAQKEYRAALQMDPSDENAKKALNQLKYP